MLSAVREGRGSPAPLAAPAPAPPVAPPSCRRSLTRASWTCGAILRLPAAFGSSRLDADSRSACGLPPRLDAERLDTVVGGVRHVDGAALDGDRFGGEELPIAGAVTPPGLRVAAVRVEPLDAVVAPVGDIDRAVRGDEEPSGIAEITAPPSPVLPVRAEVLDAVVRGIRDVDRAVRGDRDAVGERELLLRVAPSAPLSQVGARAIEILDAVVIGVRDVDRTVRAPRRSRRRR